MKEKEKFVYVLNYLKTFKAVHKNNSQMDSLQQNKKDEDSCVFQSLYSRKVARIINALHLLSFAKKSVSGIK